MAAASSCSIYEDPEWSQSLARALALLILCLSRARDRDSCEFVAALALGKYAVRLFKHCVFLCISAVFPVSRTDCVALERFRPHNFTLHV